MPDLGGLLSGLKGKGGDSGGGLTSILGGLKGAGGESGAPKPDLGGLLSGLKGKGGDAGGGGLASMLGGLKGAGSAGPKAEDGAVIMPAGDKAADGKPNPKGSGSG